MDFQPSDKLSCFDRIKRLIQRTDMWCVSRGHCGAVRLIDDVRIWNYPLPSLSIGHVYLAVYPEAKLCLDGNYPVGDLNGDCKVNIDDFSVFAGHWRECRRVPDCTP